jgi:hypothetical protein
MSEQARFKIIQTKDRRWELYKLIPQHEWVLIAGNLLSRQDAESIMKYIVEGEQLTERPIFYNEKGIELV